MKRSLAACVVATSLVLSGTSAAQAAPPPPAPWDINHTVVLPGGAEVPLIHLVGGVVTFFFGGWLLLAMSGDDGFAGSGMGRPPSTTPRTTPPATTTATTRPTTSSTTSSTTRTTTSRTTSRTTPTTTTPMTSTSSTVPTTVTPPADCVAPFGFHTQPTTSPTTTSPQPASTPVFGVINFNKPENIDAQGYERQPYAVSGDVYRVYIDPILGIGPFKYSGFDAEIGLPAGFELVPGSLTAEVVNTDAPPATFSDVSLAGDVLRFRVADMTARHAGRITADLRYVGTRPTSPQYVHPRTSSTLKNVTVEVDGVAKKFATVPLSGDVKVLAVPDPSKNYLTELTNGGIAGTVTDGKIDVVYADPTNPIAPAGKCLAILAFSYPHAKIEKVATRVSLTITEDPRAPFALPRRLSDTTGIHVEGSGIKDIKITRSAGQITIAYTRLPMSPLGGPDGSIEGSIRVQVGAYSLHTQPIVPLRPTVTFSDAAGLPVATNGFQLMPG